MDTFDKETRSWVMSRVPSKNTSPEMKVRKALHTAGFRYRLHSDKLPGRPDIVLPKYKFAIFVNGCFWHGHGCRRSTLPQANRDYWEAKICRTVGRDQTNRLLIVQAGWEPVIIWECDLGSEIQHLIDRLRLMEASLLDCHRDD